MSGKRRRRTEYEVLKAIREQAMEMLINFAMRKDLTKREKEMENFLLEVYFKASSSNRLKLLRGRKNE